MSDRIYKDQSKLKLQQLITTRLNTVMIGALASVEKYFGDLWGQDGDEPLTIEQEQFLATFEDLRSEILDKGNNQLRLLSNELDSYDIAVKYNYLPQMNNIKPVRRTQGNDRRN